MKQQYLSEEDQFKDILNNEEIGRIKDSELRDIRWKYWIMFHQAFLDEHRIPDNKLGEEYNRIKKLEKIELDEYKRRRGLL